MKIKKTRSMNEEVLDTNLDVEVNDSLQGVVSPTYVKAVQDHKERTAARDEILKDRAEKAKELNRRGAIKRNAGSKEMRLSEAKGDREVLSKAERERQKALDQEYPQTIQDLIYMELFGEKHYVPSLSLPGKNYDNELEVIDLGVSEAERAKYNIPSSTNIVGVAPKGKTSKAREKELERIKKLADILELDYAVIGDNEKGIVYFDDYTAYGSAGEYLRDLGIEPVEDNKRLRHLVSKLDWDFIDTKEELRYALNYEKKHGNKFTDNEIDYIVDNIDKFTKRALKESTISKK